MWYILKNLLLEKGIILSTIRHTAGKDDHNRTIAGVLKERYSMSRSLLRRIKREGSTFLNGDPVFLNERLKEGDTLIVEMDIGRQSQIDPEDITPDIIYEDDSLLVLNKPPGMLVHPVRRERSGTLANAIMGHWQKSGKAHGVFRPVFRIDRDTSGLVVVSGNHLAHLSLARQIQDKTMERIYIAVVGGLVSSQQGIIDLPIARKPGSIVEREVSPLGSQAVTHYRVIKRLPQINASVLEVKLETGRTHQIRVHMSHWGHPLLGDSLYGGRGGSIARQALHSYRAAFSHPLTGARMDLYCPLPQDMKELVGVI